MSIWGWFELAHGSYTYSVPKTNNNIKIRIDWNSHSDIAGNYSDVTVIVTVVRGVYGQNSNSTSDLSKIYIDGQVFESRKSIGGSSNSQTELARATHRVQHNSDGSKFISIAFEHDFRLSWSGNWIGNQRFDLNNQQLDIISRLSNFELTDSEFDMGVNINIRILPVNDSSEHRFRFRWHNRDDILSEHLIPTVTNFTWQPQLDYAENIPYSTSSWGTLILETWKNGVKLGETTKQIILNLPGNIKPVIKRVSLSDTNNIVSDILGEGNDFIQGKSNVRVTYHDVSGVYGSTITSYRTEIVGQSTHYADGNNATLGVMHFFGTFTVRSYVTDSRGRQSDYKESMINVLEYFSPVGNFVVVRGGASKDKLLATINAKVSPLNNKNQMTIKLFSTLTGGNYTNDLTRNPTAIYEWINRQIQLVKTYPANQSYQVKLEIWDKFSILSNTPSVVAITSIATESKPFALHPNGAMINTVNPLGALNVNGDIYAFDKLIQLHALTQKDGKSIYRYGIDFNDEIEAGEFFKRDTDANNPAKLYGFLTVRRSINDVFQTFVVNQSGDVYIRYHVINANRWSDWFNTSRATFLSHRNGGYAHAYCQKGTDLGEFLKSNRVPVGLSVIRDQNVSANIIVIKESNNWIYGVALTQQRLEVVRVLGGAYRGYSGWPLP